ncbi:MAG: DUF4837 family protein [Bacteroidota bacterium]
MKTQLFRSFALLMTITLFFSCSSKVKHERSTGKTNEILIITNSKADWNGEVGKVIKDFFEQALPGLPQPEPMFRLFNIAEKDFNKVFKAMHNIFIVDIDASFAEAIVETRSDHWSKPQRLIKVTAPDIESFREVFEEHKTAFLKAFNELEIERTNGQFLMAKSVKMANKLERKFGFTLQMPGGFAVGSEDEHFIWLKQSMHKVKQDVELGILIYEQAYTDTSVFVLENIISTRDSLSKIHIPGPSEGSYMVISRGFVEPEIIVKDDFVTGYAVETRGIWMVENDFMGGPFISYTFVDPELKRVITLDGYVYNPGDLKRNFIRQMEAIFHTIRFSTENN